MISIYRWDRTTRVGRRVDAAGRDALGDRPTGTEVMWVDLQDPTEEEEQLVFGEWFPLHALTQEDITRLRRLPESPPHLPKAEEFSDYLFVVVNPLAPGVSERIVGGKLNASRVRLATQLSAVLTEQLLITHHYQPMASIDSLRDYLKRHDAQAERGPDYLFHLVLDETVDEYAPVLDFLEDELDRLEERIFGKPSPTLLPRFLRIKRIIVHLRKSMIHEREVLARLQRGDFALIDERERHYYRNVYDHLLRFTELIEGARDMVSDLMQSHLSAVSHRLNEVMKALAMVSTIVLPMTLIAGIYGMNFEQHVFPDFKESAWGFWGALALMAVTGMGTLGLFKWRRWL